MLLLLDHFVNRTDARRNDDDCEQVGRVWVREVREVEGGKGEGDREPLAVCVEPALTDQMRKA